MLILVFLIHEIFAQILKGIDAMPSVKSVMLAGMGEPLLHKDIISMVRQLAKRHVQVELLTNGTMLSGTANMRKQLHKPDSRRQRFAAGWFGLRGRTVKLVWLLLPLPSFWQPFWVAYLPVP